MPIREFQCSAGHLTEKILHGALDERTGAILCPHIVDEQPCNREALRLHIPTRTGAPQFVAGCGGFYSPSRI